MADKVLVVDDGPETINFLKLILDRQGYQTLTAINGMQALEIARELGERASEGLELGALGNRYFALGQTQTANEFYQLALAIASEIEDQNLESLYTNNIAYVLAEQGKLLTEGLGVPRRRGTQRKRTESHSQDIPSRQGVRQDRSEASKTRR